YPKSSVKSAKLLSVSSIFESAWNISMAFSYRIFWFVIFPRSRCQGGRTSCRCWLPGSPLHDLQKGPEQFAERALPPTHMERYPCNLPNFGDPAPHGPFRGFPILLYGDMGSYW